MKYVANTHEFIIFSSHISHNIMADLLTHEATSAGYVTIRDNKITCHGESVTLGLSPKEHDETLISLQLARE